MWRKGIVILIGCWFMLQAWVTEDGVMVFTLDTERVEEAKKAGEMVMPIRMAPAELYDLPEPACEALKQRMQKRERKEDTAG